MIPGQSVLEAAESADNQAKTELDNDNSEQAAVWAELAVARSIAALTAAVQNIADAISFHAKP